MPEVKTKHNKKEFQEFILAGIEAKIGVRPKKVRIRHKGGNITGLELVWDSPYATTHQQKEMQDFIDDLGHLKEILGL